MIGAAFLLIGASLVAAETKREFSLAECERLREIVYRESRYICYGSVASCRLESGRTGQPHSVITMTVDEHFKPDAPAASVDMVFPGEYCDSPAGTADARFGRIPQAGEQWLVYLREYPESYEGVDLPGLRTAPPAEHAYRRYPIVELGEEIVVFLCEDPDVGLIVCPGSMYYGLRRVLDDTVSAFWTWNRRGEGVEMARSTRAEIRAAVLELQQ